MNNHDNSIYKFQSMGRVVFVQAMLLERISNEPIPTPVDDAQRKALVQFLSDRAQRIHGIWPVHVILPNAPSLSAAELRFTGIRVYANCGSVSSQNPEVIEKLIIVWHQEVVEVQFPASLSYILDQVPWSKLAERLDL